MAKREQKIQSLLPEYLAGKSEEKKNEFLSRPIDKQYSALIAWNHRRKASSNASRKSKSASERGLTSAEVIKHMRSLPELILMIDNIPDLDFDVMYAALDDAREALHNYHRHRQALMIAALEKERDEIQRKIDKLRGE